MKEKETTKPLKKKPTHDVVNLIHHQQSWKNKTMKKRKEKMRRRREMKRKWKKRE